MRQPAKEPNDPERLFVERADAGDVEGLVALYEPAAVVDDGTGEVATGREALRRFFVRFLAGAPRLEPGKQAPALLGDDLALTSSRLRNGDRTSEVARRQPDGSWLSVIDQFALCKEA